MHQKYHFGNKDETPMYNVDNPKSYEFSGNRIYRREYKTKNGIRFNADMDGVWNIMRESNIVSLEVLYNKGEVDTPVRIRVTWVIRWKLKYQTS